VNSNLDVDAQRDRDQLLIQISNLLAHNSDLAERMGRLEGYYHDSNSVLTFRPASRVSTTTTVQTTGTSRLAGKVSTYTQMLRRGGRGTQYEYELEESRVYRKAQREVDDVTSCRSTALSHAWSALSDISLSDISALSVVALPLYRIEITNAYHYMESTKDNTEGPEQVVHPQSTFTLSGVPESNPSRENNKGLGLRQILSSSSRSERTRSPHSPLANGRPSTELKLVVIGTPEADICSLVAEVGGTMNTKPLSSLVIY